MHTDEAQHYKKPGKEFDKHERSWRRDTNRVEGFCGRFKRGMTGVYQHCGENHLLAYLNEFDFRYSNRSSLLPTNSLSGVGRVLRARRIASSRRRAVSSSVYCSPSDFPFRSFDMADRIPSRNSDINTKCSNSIYHIIKNRSVNVQ
ncbi:MAG: transposase [Methylocella sp.]